MAQEILFGHKSVQSNKIANIFILPWLNLVFAHASMHTFTSLWRKSKLAFSSHSGSVKCLLTLSQGEENSSTTPLVIPWYLPNVLQNKQIDYSKLCTEQNTLFIEHTWNHQTFIHKFWFPHWRWHHNLSGMHRTISQCYHKTNQNPLFLLQQWFKIKIICSDWLPLYNTHSNLRFHLCKAQPESLLFAWDP